MRVPLKRVLFVTSLVLLQKSFFLIPSVMAQVANEADFINALTTTSPGGVINVSPNIEINFSTAAGITSQNGLIINGNGSSFIRTSNDRFFSSSVDFGGFQNIAFKGGQVSNSSGGAVLITSDLTGNISNTIFDGNTISISGGSDGFGTALYIDGDFNGNLLNSIFSENKGISTTWQSESRGALTLIRNINGKISDSIFANNTLDNNIASGAALHVTATLTEGIFSSSFENNRIKYADISVGGAVFIHSLLGGINDTKFLGNQIIGGPNAQESGGAALSLVFLSGGIHSSQFDNNEITTHANDTLGGAVYIQAKLEGGIYDSSFTNNSAHITSYDITGIPHNFPVGGGAASITHLDGNITSSFFENNIYEFDHDFLGNGGALNITLFTGSIVNSEFKNNSIITSGQGIVSGGAVSIAESYEYEIRDSKFIGNKAINTNNSPSGGALGGAIFFSRFSGPSYNNITITGSEFNANAALIGNGIGYGGALYGEAISSLKIENTNFLNNEVNGLGGAIYINTYDMFNSMPNGLGEVTLSATQGQETIFSGNKDNNGANSIYFGRNSSYLLGMGLGQTASNVNYSLLVSGAGTVSLLDPITTDMDSGMNFSMTRDISLGDGLFQWGGKNNLSVIGGGAATINLTSGKTVFEDDFTLVSASQTPMSVILGGSHNLAFYSSRPGSLAFFNFTSGDIASSLLNLHSGTSIEVTVRSLVGFENRYLVSDGIGATNSDIAGVQLIQTSELSLSLDNSVTDQLWLLVKYKPDIPEGGNTGGNNSGEENCITGCHGFDALQQWLLNSTYGRSLSDQQFIIFKQDLNSAPPEAAVSLGNLNIKNHVHITDHAMESAFNPSVTGQNRVRILASQVDLGNNTEHDIALKNYSSFLWGSAFGNFSRMSNYKGFSGVDADLYGVLGGLTWQVDPNFGVSGYLGYSSTQYDYSSIHASADSEGFHSGLLGHLKTNWFDIKGKLGYSHFRNDLSRWPAFLGTSTSTYNQNIYSSGFELSKTFSFDLYKLRPFAGLNYVYMRQSSILEEGGYLASRVNGTDAYNLTSSLGAAVSYDHHFSDNRKLTSYISLGWNHEFGDRQLKARTHFLAPLAVQGCAPVLYDVKSFIQDKDTLVGGFGFSMNFDYSQNIFYSLSADYQAEIGKNYNNHSGVVRFSVNF